MSATGTKLDKIQAIGISSYENWQEAKKFTYQVQTLKSHDIDIKIEACGICGSDMHAIKGDWGKRYLPLAVGHEIIGTIVNLGDDVDSTKFKIGDRVGVGAQAGSCGSCNRCTSEHEQYCKDSVLTYLGVYKDRDNFPTQGGYANYIRVTDGFTFKIPDGLESKHAAPLMCGGITGFTPLLSTGVKKGTKVGVVGIGGIGHMTILFAKALGAEVTAISRNNKKKDLAKQLGADHYIATDEEGYLEKYGDSLDVIINTGSSFSQNSIESVLSLLKACGTLSFITAPPVDEMLKVSPFLMLSNGYKIQGTAVGTYKDIEYMLQLAADKGIKPWVEEVDISEKNVSKVWQRMEDGDVKFRFVLTNYDDCFTE